MRGALRIGTRASSLALAQSGLVAAALQATGSVVDLIPLTTPGDGETAPLAGRAHEGIFVSSVRAALLAGEIDLAVHSFKDVPTEEVDGLLVAAVPMREDPRDEVVALRPLTGLAAGAVVGTCSVRRAAWVHRTRPDLVVRPIRGNIDQRITRVGSEFDGVILAAAGINRLGCATPGRFPIPVTDLIPAPAQGALAIECRVDDAPTRLQLHTLDHHDSHLAASAERAVLAAIDPTDATAVGAVAVVRSGRLHVIADMSRPDGTGRLLVRADGAALPGGAGLQIARKLGADVAARLLERSERSWATAS